MKSLFKALDILEYVITRNGANVTPSEAAEALDVNLVTCTRIMRAWTERGYLANVSRKSGYTPGPMIASIGLYENVYHKLAAAAAAPIADLAHQLRRKINFSVMHRGKRVKLAWNMGSRVQASWPNPKLLYAPHWGSATGRLLLANMPQAEAREILRKEGVTPFPQHELELIKKSGIVHFEDDRGLEIIGGIVRVPGYPLAAFGFGVDRERVDEALAATRQTIKKIKEALNHTEPDY